MASFKTEYIGLRLWSAGAALAILCGLFAFIGGTAVAVRLLLGASAVLLASASWNGGRAATLEGSESKLAAARLRLAVRLLLWGLGVGVLAFALGLIVALT
jgi:hypothetical protein